MKPLRSTMPLAPPRVEDPALRAYLGDLGRMVREYLSEIATAVNDEVLVRPDWVRALDADYTALPSDRMLLFFPTANRVLTLPAPANMTEPHPIAVRHASGANTVTIDPAGAATIDGAATLALAAGEGRIVVALRQPVVDRDGVGTAGWYSMASL